MLCYICVILLQVFDFELSQEDMAILDTVHRDSPFTVCEAPE